MPPKSRPEFQSSSTHAVLRVPLYYRRDVNRHRLERHVFDANYIRLLGEGDEQTERHFSQYFGDLLFIKLRGRLRSPQLVEDARQETLLRVLTRLRTKGSIEYPERLGAFVNSVCENVLSEFFRAESRFMPVPEYAPEPADSSATAESEFITEERKNLVRAALGKLSGNDRQLLRRVFLEEKDKDEVATEFGITRDYLRVRVHRAVARLRLELTKPANADEKTKVTGA
jgi:RNA polymerase sigma-70 factor, ECF subfamily